MRVSSNGSLGNNYENKSSLKYLTQNDKLSLNVESSYHYRTRERQHEGKITSHLKSFNC